MKPLSTDELREMYLDFFVQKGHRLCPSDVLVPKWDKSVLFTPAGMNPFKDHFLGKVNLEFTKATSCQKCLRTGDIDNVGRTAFHHTFFEMLGNFSFGDYFKKEAIHWAWEFLTGPKWLAIDPDRLTVTVYLDDDEAANIWHDEVGLPLNRIKRMDEHDNFWPAGAPSQGPDGVCGPCSEIFYLPPGAKSDVEIWNLVFTQFNRDGQPPNNLRPLPSKNIDTGMGLERTAAQLQQVETNFHIDILKPIVLAAAEVCGVNYVMDSDNGRRLRRITDHVRACTFAIHENVYPGAAKEEYVVRRLLRRAVLDGHQMGMREPFLHHLVGQVAEMTKRPYPELCGTVERVAQVIKREEETFLSSIDGALIRIEKIFSKSALANSQTIDGNEVADLYQTYGVPPELFEVLAAEKGLAVDQAGYRAAMARHGEVSGKIAETVMGDHGPIDEIKKSVKSTYFLGYQQTTASSSLCGLVSANEVVTLVNSDSPEVIVILRKTPFYAESGGQVGDTGTIQSETGLFRVTDTQKNGDLFLHYGAVEEGEMQWGQAVEARVDSVRRDAIRRAHSATHILHHALQTTLGSHAQQRGSKVSEDWLRFDFSNMNAVSQDELAAIERITNERIQSAAEITAEILPLAEARQKGAMMLFGEKYPDPVRMITIGDFSRELCGGIHLGNSQEVGLLEIQFEEGVSTGTRRIEALTGERAAQFRDQVNHQIEIIVKALGTQRGEFPFAVLALSKRVKELRKSLASGRANVGDPGANVTGSGSGAGNAPIAEDYLSQRNALRETARLLNVSINDVASRVLALVDESRTLIDQISKNATSDSITADDLAQTAVEFQGVKLIAQEVPGLSVGQLRQLVDELRSRLSPVAVFLASAIDLEKVMLVAAVSPDLVKQGLHAGDWVKAVAPVVGGSGGGKPDFAQAGGKQPENIKPAVREAETFFKTRLAR